MKYISILVITAFLLGCNERKVSNTDIFEETEALEMPEEKVIEGAPVDIPKMEEPIIVNDPPKIREERHVDGQPEWIEPKEIDIKVREGTYTVEKFTLEALEWRQKELENGNFKGEIGKLKIYKDGDFMQSFEGLSDPLVNFQYVLFIFGDYNMDGHPDFRIFRDCGGSCWFDYYIYNPKTGKFNHEKSWDGLSIYAMNPKTKEIQGQPEGSATCGTETLYKAKGTKLVVVKETKYGDCD